MKNTCDTTYCILCAAAILDRIKTVARLFAPARKAKDTEAVHDLRVASRRLRAAITLFSPCLPRRAKLWRRQVRKITRALGQARDLDVQIEFVESFVARSSNAEWQYGLDRLLKRLRNRRQAAQAKVVRTLARAAATNMLGRIRQALTKTARAAGRDVSATAQAYRLAEGTIVPLLSELLSHVEDLHRPEATEQHHRMRIAAKHLRYSLEIFEPLYGQSVAPAMRAARKMQTLLGELHDCDVWVAMLPEFLDAERRRAANDCGNFQSLGQVVQGIDALRADRLRARPRLHRQCLKSWKGYEENGTWSKLSKTVRQAPAGETKRPRRGRAEAKAAARRARSR